MVKIFYTHISWVTEEEDKKTWCRSDTWRQNAEIFSALMQDTKPHIQEALNPANKIKSKKTKTAYNKATENQKLRKV